MSKRKPIDFQNDLSAVEENVATNVKDILAEIRNKRQTPSTVVISKDDMGESKSPTSATQAAPRDVRDVSRPRRARPQNEPKALIALNTRVAKEGFTTRLLPQTKERLTDAKNWQKVKKQLPDDYEDILEEALNNWFVKMGY